MRNWIKVIPLGIILVVLSACGNGAESVVSDYEEAVLNDDYETLQEILSDEDVQVTEDEAVGHVKLVKEEYSEESLRRALENMAESVGDADGDSESDLRGEGGSIVTLEKEDGETAMEVERHEIFADLQYASFTYTFDGEQYTIGSSEEETTLLDNFIPGIYEIDGEGEMNGETFDMSLLVNFNGSSQKTVTVKDDMGILYTSIASYQGLENLKVYANGKDVTDLEFERGGYGPISAKEPVEVYAEGEIEGQVIQTDKVEVGPRGEDERAIRADLEFDHNEIEKIQDEAREKEQTARDSEYAKKKTEEHIPEFYEDFEESFNADSEMSQTSSLRFSFSETSVPDNVLDVLRPALETETEYEIEVGDIELTEHKEDNSELIYEVNVNIKEDGSDNKQTHTITYSDESGLYRISDIKLK
ncbi:TcaA 3rd/4th domain-containing protein [Salinicoccus halodurans]|uniref:Uncharacterized protein n=1 Tax=Salinicoccus halodurans TaxID=407035 RepID=A0A0F7HI88_9STAP|nr:hypothetical protein [Salinicoccus halodurans]AKG73264.1 hypothetical protein AAT16_02950 [Salinicoccus halodurans]SFK83143.1 hypothetical protein SAMN05216235_1933 [Salinicoccus halodurans]